MRKLIGIIAIIVVVSCLSGLVLAEDPTVTIDVAAGMTEILELNHTLWKMPKNEDILVGEINPETGLPGNTENVTGAPMNFGTLVETPIDVDKDGITDTIIYLPEYYFCVTLYPSSSGKEYKLYQRVSTESEALKRALIATPDYEEEDLWWPGGPKQGVQPDNAKLADPIWAAYTAADQLIYESGNPGKGRIIRCIYGIATGRTENETIDERTYYADPALPEGVPYTPDDTSDDVVGPITKDFGGNFDATAIFTLTL